MEGRTNGRTDKWEVECYVDDERESDEQHKGERVDELNGGD